MKNLFLSFVLLFISNLFFAQNSINIEDAKKIGQLHNNYLKQGLINNPNNIEDLKSNFIKIELNGVNNEIKNETIDFFQNNNINKQEEIIFTYLKSSESKNLYSSIKNTIINSKTFSQTSKELDLLLDKSKSLDGKEKEIVLTLIETSRSSLIFWLPKELGGQGGGENYAKAENQAQSINWGAIAYSDGAGAVGVLIRTWYLASFGPLSWGTILGAIGWGAAWGSGTALLYQLM